MPCDWTDRFLARVTDTERGCWEWTGTRDRNGYGLMCIDGRRRSVHRIAYEAVRGPIPVDLEIDHLCRTRACANPDHLEAVPHRINVLRGVSFAARKARQTHCVNGHRLDAVTIYRAPNGTRKCRICRTAANERYRRRRRGVACAAA
ncbi:HNH endonuclease signature motif containing protein [Streptomyces sp. XD-27]|uniref:HNH endonuclease signature motif containing protein n=1 Tax=Streptomyces sp. XD-27 TaxID=3062779 RepID=UPI0026F426BF|nr:HNH endonuclease signature motif containing protein [Streptomyces sp. XD-27]WKX70035.1 HNH endonuclease signature motif containing protein [Streptomyces sp. XD-27]